MIPSGTYVTVQLAGQVTGIQTPSDVQAAIAAELSAVPLVVRQVTLRPRGFFESVMAGQIGIAYDYTATAVVQTQTEYAQLDDVRAIVVHAFYDQAGSLPSGSALGAAGTTPPAPPTSDASPSPLDALGAWLQSIGKNLQTDVQLVVVGLVVVAAIGVVVLVKSR